MLKLVDGKWQFKSEKELEKFLFENLERCLGYRPVARQLRIAGEICDIVAADSEGTPIILELKNTEDRYIVQQLTRYYDNLVSENPELPGVDLSREPKLIAITPHFHRHNFIDRKYSTLEVQLLEFLIQEKQNRQYLQFFDPDRSQRIGRAIPLPQRESNGENISPFDELEAGWKQALSGQSSDFINWALALRSQILGIHESMGTVATASSITFGQKQGKEKLCKSEQRLCIRIERLSKSGMPSLFVYLPAYAGGFKIVKIEILFSDLSGSIQSLRLPGKCLEKSRYRRINGVKCDGVLSIAQYLSLHRFRRQGAKYEGIDIVTTYDFLKFAQQDWLERLNKSARVKSG